MGIISADLHRITKRKCLNYKADLYNKVQTIGYETKVARMGRGNDMPKRSVLGRYSPVSVSVHCLCREFVRGKERPVFLRDLKREEINVLDMCN